MIDFKEELDASLDFGSGYICLIGPPCSGKTSIVLEYLASREGAFNRKHNLLPTVYIDEDEHDTNRKPLFKLEYVSARSLCGDTLGYLSRTLLPKRGRRLIYECTPVDFCYYLTEWLEGCASGSELHFVIDDADLLQESPDSIDLWLSDCLRRFDTSGSLVCVWLVLQMPLRLTTCFRYHFVALPRTELICGWLSEEYFRNRSLIAMNWEDGEPDMLGNENLSTEFGTARRLSTEDTHHFAMRAVHYYATHQPMCGSVICKDTRILLKRVYQLLPGLVAVAGGDVSNLNAVHYARVWGRFKEISDIGSRCDEPDPEADKPSSLLLTDTPGLEHVEPVVHALKRISYSAVLLAFAAFYCGVVPKNKQIQVFNEEIRGVDGNYKSAVQAHAQSHKASVLSASAHVMTLERLLLVYDAMRGMCETHFDGVELTTPKMAAQYIHGFIDWGLLTPAGTPEKQKFHCWISVTTALQLGRTLSLNLFELIPN